MRPMFDQMFNGLNFGTGIGVVGRDVTGSEALRRHASFRADIANGNFRNVANTLNTANIGVTVPAGQTIAGGTLRVQRVVPGKLHYGQSAILDDGDAEQL